MPLGELSQCSYDLALAQGSYKKLRVNMDFLSTALYIVRFAIRDGLLNGIVN